MTSKSFSTEILNVSTSNLTIYTLHPIPYTLHPSTPHPSHPTPHTLHTTHPTLNDTCRRVSGAMYGYVPALPTFVVSCLAPPFLSLGSDRRAASPTSPSLHVTWSVTPPDSLADSSTFSGFISRCTILTLRLGCGGLGWGFRVKVHDAHLGKSGF